MIMRGVANHKFVTSPLRNTNAFVAPYCVFTPCPEYIFYDLKCMFSIPCTCYGLSLGLLSDAVLAYADENAWNYWVKEVSEILHSLDASENQKWNKASDQVLVDLSRTYSSFRIEAL
jgi:hypothetical protein